MLPAMRSLALALLWTAALAAGAQAQGYAGEWQASPLTIQNRTASWGADCPGRLPARQSEPGGNVRIAQSGDHLTLSGATRGNTRSCFGENPALRRVSSRYQNGTWTIVCRTPESDSRAESARYSLRATDENTLTYRETTEWDWQLNESRCRVTRTATRTFRRAGVAPEPPSEPEPPTEPEQPACEAGPPANLRLSPREASVAPGEQVCFSARVVDAAGCTVRGARPTLRLEGGEGLTLRGRCVAASSTASGTFRIQARHGDFSARASGVVSQEDLSDLIAQRSGRTLGQDGGEASGDGASGVSASAEGADMTFLLGGLAALVVLLLLAAVFFLRRKKEPVSTYDAGPSDVASGAVENAGPAVESAIPVTAAPSTSAAPSASTAPSTSAVPSTAVAAPIPAPAPPPKPPSVCPKCEREWGDTIFCPEDGTELIDLSDPRVIAKGKICPKCRTGYGGDVDRCQHDGETLVFYALFDARQKLTGAGQRTCSQCGRSFGADVAFCPEDGTKLG